MKRYFLLIVILTFLLSSCAGASYQSGPMLARDDYGGGFASEDAVYEVAEAEAPLPSEGDFSGSGDTSSIAVERMVIKNASLEIVVADPAQAMDEIITMADEMGGFIVSSELWQRSLNNGVTVDQATINIRVPAEHLDEALTLIKAGAGEVRHENIYGQDVTGEYTDLQSRLRNLEAAENQLAEIMDEARKTEDVLQVYNQLVSVREQIEVIKGQMKYYEQASALSSISIEIIADEADQPIQIGGWQPVGVAKDAVEALINFLQGFVNFVIWLVIFLLPVLLVIGIPLVFIWRGFRAWRRRRKEKKQARTEVEDTASEQE